MPLSFDNTGFRATFHFQCSLLMIFQASVYAALEGVNLSLFLLLEK